jgi:hypothetical protein
MATIVQVQRIDGRVQPVDIEPLTFERLAHGSVEPASDSILHQIVVHDKYFHPEMRFIVVTSECQYRGPRPGDTRRHVAKTVLTRKACQWVDEEWLMQNGYERLGTRQLAARIGRSNAPFDSLIRSAMKRGLIEQPVEFPSKGDFWFRLKNLDSLEHETKSGAVGASSGDGGTHL